jgi:hypothetical protein
MTKDIEDHILGSNKVVSIFGYWPSFHDAEVLELRLWRGDVNPSENRWIMPVLTVRMHFCELAREIHLEGNIFLRNHTLVTFEFRDLSQLLVKNFDSENSMLRLAIVPHEQASQPKSRLSVTFEGATPRGMTASFSCLEIEVIEAVPCSVDENGIVLTK